MYNPGSPMPNADATRWNERYRTTPRPSSLQPRDFLTRHAHYLPKAGLALDVAMGLGGNAAYLMARGLRVIGVDISDVAVRRAKAWLPGLNALIADLTQFGLPAESLDALVNFYYLDRNLWPIYRQALRPGGVLVVETLTEAMPTTRSDLNPDYLLKPGELRRAFADWEILAYVEGWNSPDDLWHRSTAGLVARRPR